MVSAAASTDRASAGSFVLPLYALTLFISAFLLFFVQPMFAKMVLPRFGGAPAVWNTAMVFFQGTLLLGYFYAHLSTRLLGLRRQTLLHGGVLLVGLLPLPIAVAAGWTAPPAGYEIPWLIGLLAVSVGLPFFAVSATAPLLQQWFARTDHPAAGDPYFLYGASNVGSLLALLAYPVLVEPNVGAGAQARLWTFGYLVLAALIATCATLLWRRYRPDSATSAPAAESELIESVTWRLRGRWLLLSTVPSALLLGVTLHIGTEIAAVPFFWVLPLALYLLTFVLVFARRPLLRHSWMLHAQVVVIAFVAGFYIVPNLYLVVVLHIVGMFITAMVCHGELARLRPRASHLTEFYLWMSVGGVLGGLLAAIVAPLVFDSIYEYPLALILGLLVRPAGSRTLLARIVRLVPATAQIADTSIGRVVPLALDVALPLAFLWLLASGWWAEGLEWLWDYVLLALSALGAMEWETALWIAYQPLFLTLCILVLARRRLRFALATAVVVYMLTQTAGDDLEKVRTFFGVYTAAEIDRGATVYRFLYHGRTNHGGQIVGQPYRGVTYYAANGPVGQLFLAHRRMGAPLRHVAVTGLGVGALACHVRPGPERALTYFEIDPEVERLARAYFEYLSTCGTNLTVEIGDGRLAMEQHPDRAFDMILLDAFAGDAIPAHLLTLEAFRMYERKLSDTGWLVVHITNSYIDLLPVVTATLAEIGMVGRTIDFGGGFPTIDFTYNSAWVVAARTPEELEAFDRAANPWTPLEPVAARPWTDDFSNLFRALRWGEAGVFGH